MVDIDPPLAETIRTYDALATRYARRVADAALVADMRTFVTALPGPAVLDAGCGSGRDLRLLSEAGCTAIGVDLSLGMLHQARRTTGQPLTRADFRALPFGSSVFDGVWACASLVHLDARGQELALQEFRRVLRPAGVLFGAVRLGEAEWHDNGAGLRRYFGEQSVDLMRKHLRAAGLRARETRVVAGGLGGRWLHFVASPVGKPEASPLRAA